MMREGHASDAKRDICLPGWAAAGYSDGSRFASTATLHFGRRHVSDHLLSPVIDGCCRCAATANGWR